MEQIWKIAFGVAGLAAVAAFVLYGLYKQWLSIPALAKLTRDQQFKLFTLFLVFTFVFAVAGVWTYRDIKRAEITAQKEAQPKVGQDSVAIGRVSGPVGDRSVVIGATDSNGNVILNQPMAVGFGAKAGPGSIAIGANASAGVPRTTSTNSTTSSAAGK